ncbi:hypothetical protein LMG33818_000884 [Halomonadaceae bacterium LMG 33818]|uniref:hypothetical protein n=1 Tax=Cernens ardua TaxID=3402176 RepID=UPI003EDB7990
MPSLDRPESSAVVDFIDGCYHGIARMRRYAEGFPVPLSLIEIDRYVERFPILIDRDEFDSAIYAMDEVMLDNMQKERDEKSPT